jgi:alkaline phosphatase D
MHWGKFSGNHPCISKCALIGVACLNFVQAIYLLSGSVYLGAGFNTAYMGKRILVLAFVFISGIWSVFAQGHLLQSGPMVGYADMREVMLWAQTNAPADVHFRYRPMGSKKPEFRTAVVRTEAALGYTAHGVADRVEPGVVYDFDVYINNRLVSRPYPTQFTAQSLWQWRTDPPDFSVVLGSCAYDSEPKYDRPGRSYGSDYHIFETIAGQKPDLMLWLGDNFYYREPDWATRTGMLHRATHSRSIPELQPLLAACSHYAVWDDHDFGPNDSDRTWIHKQTARDVFKSFWGNPTYGLDGSNGITSYFQYNDVDFFLLDNRYFRTANQCKSCPRTILGAEQLAWIMEALSASRAPYKVVAIGGQVLTTENQFETYASQCPEEREALLAHIERENIKGVVFVSGDRHFSELSVITNARGNKVYDVTSSSLTAGSFLGAGEKTANAHRVPDSVVDRHNFARLTFSGPRTERRLTLTYFDDKGGSLFEYTLAR